jgi:hypothetical protein
MFLFAPTKATYLGTTTAQLKTIAKILHSQKPPTHNIVNLQSDGCFFQLQLDVPNLGSNKSKQLLKHAKELMFFPSTLCSLIQNGITTPPIDIGPKEIHNTIHASNHRKIELMPLTKVYGCYWITFLDHIPIFDRCMVRRDQSTITIKNKHMFKRD